MSVNCKKETSAGNNITKLCELHLQKHKDENNYDFHKEIIPDNVNKGYYLYSSKYSK